MLNLRRPRLQPDPRPAAMAAALAVLAMLAGGLSPLGAAEQSLVIRGQVTRAGTTRPVTAGEVELRWPGHEDRFQTVTAPIREDGSYLLSASIDTAAVPLADLTVSAICPAHDVLEVALPAPTDGDGGVAVVTVDLGVSASTLNGILNIFQCCILTWSALTVMLPAFLLGAAITAFVPSQSILGLLGPQAPRGKAYGAAVGAGIVLSLCSCNVVPLFAGIWRRGAGTGPAFAFLYSGPALDLLPIIFTCQVIGMPFGVFRTVAVSVIAVAVGVIMARLFGEGRSEAAGAATLPPSEDGPSRRVTGLLVGLLLYLLIIGSMALSWRLRLLLIAPALAGLAVLTWRGLNREQRGAWRLETWQLLRLVLPVLIPAVLVIGLVAMHTPLTVTRWLSGNNSLAASLAAAAFGALMYFPILTEVAFTKALLKVMGVGLGPAMALILTAPGLSLPGMIILRRVVGWRRLLAYAGATVLLAGLAGALFAAAWGTYLCSCAL